MDFIFHLKFGYNGLYFLHPQTSPPSDDKGQKKWRQKSSWSVLFPAVKRRKEVARTLLVAVLPGCVLSAGCPARALTREGWTKALQSPQNQRQMVHEVQNGNSQGTPVLRSPEAEREGSKDQLAVVPRPRRPWALTPLVCSPRRQVLCAQPRGEAPRPALGLRGQSRPPAGREKGCSGCWGLR